MRGLVPPDQNVLNATQNSLCRAVNRRRGCCACRASNCRRRARFSRTRSSREWKALTNQPRKCRSDTIMARIVAEKSEPVFRKSFILRVYDVLARHRRQTRQERVITANIALACDCLQQEHDRVRAACIKILARTTKTSNANCYGQS